ncbi:MAG: hypothetical protein V3T05_01345 [Myxococcota bacterium]
MVGGERLRALCDAFVAVGAVIALAIAATGCTEPQRIVKTPTAVASVVDAHR